MRQFIMASAALAASSLAAHAADLPLRGSVPDYAPPATQISWSGAYIGANAGYGFDNDHDYTVRGNDAVTRGALAAGLAPSAIRTSSDGFTGGLQIGYNYQFDGAGFSGLSSFGGPASFVVGVEADAAYTDADRTTTYTGTLGFTTRITAHTDYVGTVRGRVGLAFGPMLVYGTGGFAYGGVRDAIVGSNPGGIPLFAGRRDSLKTGYAYGGGVEYVLPTASFVNILHAGAVTAKAEFIRYDLGTSDIAAGGNAAAGTTGQSYSVRQQTTGNLVRVGLNYKLDFMQSAPVIARY